MWTGRYDKAKALIDAMRAFVADASQSALALTTLSVLESMYFMLIGNKEACNAAVEEGLAISKSHGVGVWGNQLLANRIGGLLRGR